MEEQTKMQELEDYKVFEHDDGFVKIKDEIMLNLSKCKAFIAPILSYNDDGKISLVTYAGGVPKEMVEVFQRFVQGAFVQFSQMMQARTKFPDQEDEAQPVEQETEEVVYADEESENDGQKANERVD